MEKIMKRLFVLNTVLLFWVFAAFAQVPDSDTLDIQVTDSYMPVITLSEVELDSDELSQDMSALLQSSGDVFVRTAGFTFGQGRFRIRGYDNKYSRVLINGVVVNDAETGRPYYSNWGGLNDAMWNKDNQYGLGFSDFHFGGIGGLTNIITRASLYRPQTKVSYAAANRSYRNRTMISHSTGMMANGWAYTISASKRWAQQGFVEGTFYDANAYFIGIEKKLTKQHSIGLTAYGAPSRTGRGGVAILEAYELSGNNYYNPNWGYQDGKVRNARVNTYHQPRAILSHYWTIDDNKSLTSSISYSFGRGGSTALNWYDAADPRPDYYRYLPSYYSEDEYMHQYLTYMWQNDERTRQLDWDSFYHANRKNLYTVVNESGIDGNDVTGNRAKFIIEERRNDISRWDASSVYVQDISENIRLSAGTNIMRHKTSNFKIVEDLLGADWWLDIDQFAERDFSDNIALQNDVDNPDRIVGVGDKFGYDYLSNINYANLFSQIEIKQKRADFYFGAELSYTEFWRTGNTRNGRFPENSFGDSPKNQFLDYALKAGMNYKITGRHIVMLNAANLTKAPNFRDAFISPRTRDHVVEGLQSETIYTGDISYLLRGRKVNGRITGYYTEFKDQTFNRSFYHDELRTFVNYAMTGIDKLHYGLEFGLEYKITPEISATGVVAYGQYLYDSRPSITIARDNDSEVLIEDKIAYLQNYHVGGMPEFASSVGVRYNAPKFWFVSANLNYFDYTYLEINPDRRTAKALEIFVNTDPQVAQILTQKKLDSGISLDLWGGKSWRINGNYLGFSISINNVLNNTDFITNGFEQLRYSVSDIDRFPEKYFFMYGRTYFLNVYYRF
jgi:hypothetical protein